MIERNMYRFWITLLVINFLAHSIVAQEYGTGLLLDEELYQNIPKAAPLMRGDILDVPKSFSLKSFSPTPGYQGNEATCAGWATAYAGRTILEAIRFNIGNNRIDSNVFSPSFVYNLIRPKNHCRSSVSLVDALDVLKYKGGLKLNEFEISCDRIVNESDLINAENYRIIEYREITDRYSKNKVSLVRKSITEFKPVVIAMDCPPSFKRAGELWIPDSSEYRYFGKGHALVVIGYDDEKFGGAFEVINSWGSDWGKGGFSWIRYTDFQFYCLLAVELIDKLNFDPNMVDLSGSLLFRKDNAEIMRAEFNGNYFKMVSSYSSGTKFELLLTNNQPAYVYAFSSDLTYKTYKIFPFTKSMSPLLPYRQNNVAIPNEYSYNMLDDVTGTSYFCFLYSNLPLQIEAVMREIEEAEGNFWERINKVLGDKMVDKSNIIYRSDRKISFDAKSNNKNLVAILVEFEHIN